MTGILNSSGVAKTHKGESITINSTDGYFQCPCKTRYQSCSGFRRHLKNKKCQVLASIVFALISFFLETVDLEDESGSAGTSDEELLGGCDVLMPVVPKIPTITSQPMPLIGRKYDHAVIHSCNGSEWTTEEQQRTVNIMDAYGLRPIAIINEHQVETNALTHSSNLPACINGDMKITATAPLKKRKLDSVSGLVCLDASLIGALSSGPYADHFLNEPYIELNDELATFLNQDWSVYPNLRFACSRLLAGMLFLNTGTGKILVANSIEVYARDRNMDSHNETFKASKNKTPISSLPPKVCRYRNVWPTTLTDVDGMKLVLGTKTFNALVTSSLRLDKHFEPEIGPGTCHFVLENDLQSLNTKIFIKEEAWKAAKVLAENKSANFISCYDIVYQMRQLRTRFHHQSAYLCCRSSNETTDDITTRPYTVFTLAGFDNARENSNYRSGAQLFRQVALAVIQGSNMLTKVYVDGLLRNTKAGNVKDILSAIGDLCNESSTISIIGNSDLNKHLEKLATLLSTHISTANQSISKAVAQRYQ
ncbi:hypothetical protein [Absidia glauca]|uniref:Uncharacterized protein n=1 Tax=Absidia glauca TaxID=4829 RepID=A0A170AP19_ABSGL|nr:hypothetical protein [Absidia glauca]